MPVDARQLAEWTHALRFEDLTEETIHQTKCRVLDSIGTLLGGYDSVPATATRGMAAESPGPASILGTGRRGRPELAAFANGTAVRYLDYNDTYLSLEPAHPSDNIAACWAVAEQEGANGRALITAIVAAYEIQCRLCDAASLRKHGWDHVVYGAFSATLAAAKLRGLSVEQMIHAVGMAGVCNIATRQTRTGELSHWKACAFSNVVRNALVAVDLAKRGMSGPEQIFEGPKGVFKQLTGGAFDVVLGDRERGYMLPVTYIKYWPAEYHSQSAIDAAIKMRGQWRDSSEIASMTIETFEASYSIIGCEPEKWRPTSRETADHSLPYCTIAALIDGDVTVGTFARAKFTAPEALRLLDNTKVVHNKSLDPDYPKGIPNVLKIVLKDGRTFEQRVDFPPGHSGNPLTDGQVEAKFRRLAAPKISEATAKQIVDACWGLDGLADLGPLLVWSVKA